MSSGTYNQMVQQRNETKAKLRLIMEAADRPLTAAEIAAHPTASGMKSRNIGLFIRNMKGIVFNKKNKTWALGKQETKPAKSKTLSKKEPEFDKSTTFSNAQFIIKSNGDLFLTIGDISLPVGFE